MKNSWVTYLQYILENFSGKLTYMSKMITLSHLQVSGKVICLQFSNVCLSVCLLK